MVGWLTLEIRRGWRTELEPSGLLGLRLLRARTPLPPGLREKTVCRRLDRAAVLLARSGVRRVLTPPDFPYWEILQTRGLCPVDPSPLCQAMAAPLALAELARKGVSPASGTVALVGQRVDRPFFLAAQALCPRVRTLILDAPSGGEELAGYLREEFGAAALAAGVLLPAQAVLCFSPSRAGEGGVILCGPAPDLAGLALSPAEISLPQEPDSLPLLSLLWEAGRISTGEIQVISPPPGRN